MDFSKLIERAKNVLLTPKTEWPVIAGEATTVGDLYKNYILILAALSALASFLGMMAFGSGFGPLRVSFGFGSSLSFAIVNLVMSLIGVYVVGLVINMLAPTFAAQKDSIQALKTATYSFTASWLAGVGTLVPGISGLLALIGAVYTVYLLYLGLQHTMKVPADKAVGYTAVSVIVSIIALVVVYAIVGVFTGAGMVGRGLLGGGTTITLPDGDGGKVTIDPNSSLGKLEEWGKQVEAAGKKMDAAEKSGDAKAQQEALGGVLGAVLGGAAAGGSVAESLPTDTIKQFLPETLAGLPRRSVSAERNQAVGMQISEGKARYAAEGGGPELSLEITDLGGARGVMMLAAWANIESEKQTDDGYEKTLKLDGRMVQEQWNSRDSSGEFSMVLAERFIAKVSGRDTSMDQIKAAFGQLDLKGLEALREAGVKKN
jgi:hypothetical protein